jgi:hypothetical protein
MLFQNLEPRNGQGNPLPTNAAGVFKTTFNNDVTPPITLVPTIDDENDPQDIKMVTSIMEEDFYEFVGPDPFEMEHSFNTSQQFSFRFKLKRNQPGGVTPPPCRIRSTIFFSVVSGAGERKKQQRSESIFIQ